MKNGRSEKMTAMAKMKVAAVAQLAGVVLVSGAWAQAGPPTQPAKAPTAQTQPTGRPWLGIAVGSVSDPDPESRKLVEHLGYTGDTGILVQQVMPGSPADGILRKDDIVTEVDGEKLAKAEVLRDRVASAGVGSKLTLTIFREKKIQEVNVTVEALPPSWTQGRPAGN
jgi:S1-C subfamily serine protease